MRRTLGLVLVALLIVSAGCISGGGQTTAPAEDTDSSGEPSVDTSNAGTPQFPPGVSETGVENASAILKAHTSYFQNRSFTARINTSTLTANGSLHLGQKGTFQIGIPGEGTLIRWEGKTGPGNRTIWYNDSSYFIARTNPELPSAVTTSNNTMYRNRGTRQRSSYQTIYADLNNASVSENTTISRITQNGRDLIRIQGLTRNDTESQEPTMLSLSVGSQGVIWNYTADSTLDPSISQANTTRRIYNIRIESVNESAGPKPPAWLPTAANRTDPLIPPATTSENRSG